MRKFLGVLFIIIGVSIGLYVLYNNSKYSVMTRQFSPYTVLSSSWEKYKVGFINHDGRVIDYSQNSITTSEGQSYAMLRAVWSDDKTAFDQAWKWTKENLKRPNDHLFGWRWGKRSNGSYGFIPGGGENNATDADQDIALALLLASKRWNQKSYADEAKPIISDIWKHNTGVANGQRYLTAGSWAQDQTQLVINPSYFAPYAWRAFAAVDRSHNWESLIGSSYDFLTRVGKAPLDTGSGVGLPPDWVVIDKRRGELHAPSESNLKTTYSFDAIRVPWRIALDYQWSHDNRAKDYLLSSFSYLLQSYQRNQKLASTYSHDGHEADPDEDPAMYATSIGYFMIADPALARSIYQDKIVRLYANDQNSFKNTLPYYQQNWLWFGAALYNDHLGNFGIVKG